MRGIMVRRVPKTQARVARCRGVQVHHAARILRGGHRESARSGDADDGEGAEVDSDEPVPRDAGYRCRIMEYGKRHDGKRHHGQMQVTG